MHGGTITRPAESTFTTWFTTRPLWYLTGLAIVVNGLLFGVGAVPYFAYGVEAMGDPFNIKDVGGRNVEPGSPLAWILADVIGVDSFDAHIVMHFVVLTGVLCGCAYLVARWVSDLAGRLFVVAWFASPLANVNLTWLGKPDHFTILATVLIGVGPPSAAAVGGALLGFNHFEQGVVIVAATLLVRLFIQRDRSKRWVAHLFAGFVAGRLVWMLYANAADYNASGRLDWVRDDGLEPFMRVWRGDIPTLIFGALGVLWVPVLYMARQLDVPQRIAAVSAFVLATIPTLVTLDTTRVYAILTFPLVVGCVVWTDRNVERDALLRVLPWFLLAAVFVPRVMLWGSLVPYVSSWERLT